MTVLFGVTDSTGAPYEVPAVPPLKELRLPAGAVPAVEPRWRIHCWLADTELLLEKRIVGRSAVSVNAPNCPSQLRTTSSPPCGMVVLMPTLPIRLVLPTTGSFD